MKTLIPSKAASSIKQLILAIVISVFSFSVLGQVPQLQMISSDTIFAGQTWDVEMVDPGWEGVYPLTATLTPANHIDRDLCSDCAEDSITAQQVTIDGSIITATFSVPMGTYPTMYNLYLADNNIIAKNPYMFILSKPYVETAPESVSICFGEGTAFEVKAYEPLEIIYQWYHQDKLLIGETESILMVDLAEMADTGSYYCVLMNQWGEDTTEAHLAVHPYTEEVGVPEGPVHLCMGSGTRVYDLPENPSITSYNWVLLPQEAGELFIEVLSVSVQWNPEFAGEARLFAETTSGSCGGPNSDTLVIQVVGPTMTPEICIVGVDQASGKYRVVWNKLNDGSIAGYNIYRESNQAGIFLKLNSISADESSVYVDSTSSPEALPHSYKFSYMDTCGNESELSQVHTTVHLTANLGTGGENNLSWTPYKGFPFLSYSIHRGTHLDSLQAFQDVSSNVNSFTDMNPPSQQVFYQIVVSRDGACQPVKKAGIDYSISRSNVFELNTVGIDGILMDQSVEIYPNPANHVIFVKLTEIMDKQGTISIFDVTGGQMVFRQIEGDLSSIPIATLPDGMYFVKVITDRFTCTERIVVRR